MLFMADHSRRHPNGHATWRHVMPHDRAGSGARAVAKRDRCDEQRVGAQKDILAHLSVMLARSIKITGDGSRPNIGEGADRGVASVAEVVHLHVRTKCGVLDFGKVADVLTG